ncbi:rare lipoprotein A [Enhydrobacter aerosaccus]|uniref:Endolytic peptidoglycan transglycosylase RlpA n=2 Tax=Enhydrobacter aerosaccus TaxID=225324 RepID=A0A1T4L2E3_9HYPH|nr:septal ring lytic transglycosylase RlpA family protein [Enhydrobacter aerosaccus]SJZ48884.1 rare lipoprotein A [Enhydrobacter aerosaccus]
MAPLADRRRLDAVFALKTLALVLVAASLAGCGSHRGGAPSTASRGTYKVGAPYTIDGVTYVPQEEFNHVETGTASWYGPGFHGKYTANGEVYNQAERTAAHRTLQMPAIVRVTNLDNGQSTTVRINDRGPYARSRILDVSRATAEELGMIRTGTAHIRIDQLPNESMAVKEVALGGGGPAEQMAAVARVSSGRGGTAASPPAVVQAAQPPPPPPVVQQPPVWTAPVPVQQPAPRPFTSPSNVTVASLAAASHAAGGFFVQAGSFSSMTNAERQRDLVASYGTTEISQGTAGGREVFRVRLGPYTTSDAAGIVADRLKRSGYGDARVVAD